MWRAAIALLGIMLTTSAVKAQENPTDFRSPRGALLRAAAVPGWGQIYNRQYIKLPVLYAGMGVFLTAAVQNGSDYRLYRRAFQYKAFQEMVESGNIDQNPRADFQADYDRVVSDVGRDLPSTTLEGQRDILRRNRDLSFLGAGAFWALGMLDAYVSAHLSDFDVGENLSIRVAPQAGPMGESGIRMTLTW